MSAWLEEAEEKEEGQYDARGTQSNRGCGRRGVRLSLLCEFYYQHLLT